MSDSISVLPNMTLGKSLDPIHQGFPSTAAMVALLYQGKIVDYHRQVPRRRPSNPKVHIPMAAADIPPEYFVDVQDVGRLHVAAAVLGGVQGQRIFAFAQRYNWDSILAILRKLEPAKTFPSNFSGGEDADEIKPRTRAEHLLRHLGRPGWTSLEESVRDMVHELRDLDARSSVQ